jgi:OmpA-OmpF porin, OOP family
MKKYHLLLITVLWIPFALTGQINVGDKIKEKTKQRMEQRTDEAIDNALDKTEEGLTKRVKNSRGSGEEGEEVDREGNEGQGGDSPGMVNAASADSIRPGLVGTTQYDFIPGDQILLFDDFSQDNIGDFPALWTTNGSGEVKSLNIASGRWFHMNGADATYCFMNSIALPQNFIIEFDLVPDADFEAIRFTLYQGKDDQELNTELYPGFAGVQITLKHDGWEGKGYKEDMNWVEAFSIRNPVQHQRVNHVIIWVQNRRVRIYHQGVKVLDSPTLLFNGVSLDRFRFSGWDQTGEPYISNFKITTASPDMRHKLLTEGKMVTYGITFDSGKDDVRPESHATIREIADVLKENPGLRIRITGHTDSDGNDNFNLNLSQRRAASVKMYLTTQFGIEASRIETDGKGESQPLGSNDTAQNKAKNRRVEIERL